MQGAWLAGWLCPGADQQSGAAVVCNVVRFCERERVCDREDGYATKHDGTEDTDLGLRACVCVSVPADPNET